MKVFIKFKDGIPKQLLNEPMLDQLIKQKCTERHEWECYTPEKKYVLPWEHPFSLDNNGKVKTLEEVILQYCSYVVGLFGGKDRAARALDIDRKTLYRYCKKIDNDKWLNNTYDSAQYQENEYLK